MESSDKIMEKVWAHLMREHNLDISWGSVRAIVNNYSSRFVAVGVDPLIILENIPSRIYARLSRLMHISDTNPEGLIMRDIKHYLQNEHRLAQRRRNREVKFHQETLEKAPMESETAIHMRERDAREELSLLLRVARKVLTPIQRRFFLGYVAELRRVDQSDQNRMNLTKLYRMTMGSNHVPTNNDNMRAKRMWENIMHIIREHAHIVPVHEAYYGPHMKNQSRMVGGKLRRKIPKPRSPKK